METERSNKAVDVREKDERIHTGGVCVCSVVMLHVGGGGFNGGARETLIKWWWGTG